MSCRHDHHAAPSFFNNCASIAGNSCRSRPPGQGARYVIASWLLSAFCTSAGAALCSSPPKLQLPSPCAQYMSTSRSAEPVVRSGLSKHVSLESTACSCLRGTCPPASTPADKTWVQKPKMGDSNTVTPWARRRESPALPAAVMTMPWPWRDSHGYESRPRHGHRHAVAVMLTNRPRTRCRILGRLVVTSRPKGSFRATRAGRVARGPRCGGPPRRA